MGGLVRNKLLLFCNMSKHRERGSVQITTTAHWECDNSPSYILSQSIAQIRSRGPGAGWAFALAVARVTSVTLSCIIRVGLDMAASKRETAG